MMEEPWGDEYLVDDQPIARPRPTGLLQDPEL
jgi:hypothetical protein